MTRLDVSAGRDEPLPRLLAPAPVVRGRIEIGDQRGRTLGVPTANLPVDDDSDIVDGVYAAVYVRPDGTRFAAAVSVGRRPTFYRASGCRLLEAHLLGFAGTLVGEEAAVQLVWYVRPVRAFTSTDELVGQLRQDIDVVRSLVRDDVVYR
jgi:FAD synthase